MLNKALYGPNSIDHKAFLEPEHRQILSHDDHFSGEILDSSRVYLKLSAVVSHQKLMVSIYQNHTKSVTLDAFNMNGIRRNAKTVISVLNIPLCLLSSYITTKLDQLYCELYVRDINLI